MLNGATKAAITKVDVIFPECKGARFYEELSKEAKKFVEKIEKAIQVPVTLIGTGPGTLEIVDRWKELKS